jgi:23S rRNA (cytidine1920-2'-O)/16S rRNA (cytidine1409-2'-O)-methyltransferase
MSDADKGAYVSRAGAKLDHALSALKVDVAGLVCADLGCSTGGFTDCLLAHGALKVYAIDRGYGVLDMRLRNDPRVAVMERTDALQVHLPEPVDLVTIDCGWTRQELILPAAKRLLKEDGRIVSLVKPQYESPAQLLRGGLLADEQACGVLDPLRATVGNWGLMIVEAVDSSVRGRGGNREVFWLLRQT